MKFFTRELWLIAQELGDLKTYDEQWQKAFDEYRDQLETLRGRLSESAFHFFSEADVHDGELLDLAIVDGSRPARLSEPVRVWKRSGDNPVRARLTVLDSYDKLAWTVYYEGLRRVLVDFPTEEPLFYSEGDGFGDWGYHEVSDAGNGFLRHEILFATGAVLLFEFSKVLVQSTARSASRIDSTPG